MSDSDRRPVIRQDAAARDDARIYQAGGDIFINEARAPQRRLLPEQPPGRCISEIADPYAWEVHQAITVESDGSTEHLPTLPVYVEREHDRRLRDAVQQVVHGASKIVMLVGGSSTGKTRACWEAIQLLPCSWRLWHPIEPSRPEAALSCLEAVEPNTVLWLNETQHYLLTPNSPMGENLAAGLRALLRDPERGPVLVLGTLWHEYWATLTAPPTSGSGTNDSHSQARALLTGCDLPVPDKFSESESANLNAAAAVDPRLAHAVKHAEQGHITQYLTGGPALIERYLNAPPAARAVIEVAMDAQRLGLGPTVPLSLLEFAAPSYLTNLQWGQVTDSWASQALEYATLPLHGARGPLTRIHARPGETEPSEPHYQLADYLDQRGRSERIYAVPPKAFWDAAADNVRDPAALMALAQAANDRWRYRHAVQLVRAATQAGDSRAFVELAAIQARFDGYDPESSIYRQAVETADARGLATLASWHERHGRRKEAEQLYERAADEGEMSAFVLLAQLKEGAGDRKAAERLYRRAAEAGDYWAQIQLAKRISGRDKEGAERLLLKVNSTTTDPRLWYPYLRYLFDHDTPPHLQATARTILTEGADAGDVDALLTLAEISKRPDRSQEAAVFYRRAIDAGSHEAALRLAEITPDEEAQRELYRQAAEAGNAGALFTLACMSDAAGDLERAIQLMRRAAERGESDAYWGLSDLLERNGQAEEAEFVAVSDPDGQGLSELLYCRDENGDSTGVDRLMRIGIDAGYRGDFGIGMFAELHRPDDVGWQQARRYGLEADGRPSDPWNVGPLGHY
ncbi:sel1 repeat family protein [Streptomyces pratensis]|uniref:sel1 repeat family protein n=1 Tax=Streptomyces pratensis TaxID=1169025 RepID=UPI001933C996|nr:sel1 repeat family protein [Streptomyces pratensis]